MINEVLKDDISLINELEKEFSNIKVLDDFNKNIFSKYFIYKEKSNIIAYINYYDLYERFEIANIEVKEEFRNQKIGSKLIEHLLEIAKDKKVENITLEVNVNNIYAIKLYEKYGFVKVAIREKYYDGVDGYLMERKMM